MELGMANNLVGGVDLLADNDIGVWRIDEDYSDTGTY
jgi:hypothetical protein